MRLFVRAACTVPPSSRRDVRGIHASRGPERSMWDERPSPHRPTCLDVVNLHSCIGPSHLHLELVVQGQSRYALLAGSCRRLGSAERRSFIPSIWFRFMDDPMTTFIA